MVNNLRPAPPYTPPPQQNTNRLGCGARMNSLIAIIAGLVTILGFFGFTTVYDVGKDGDDPPRESPAESEPEDREAAPNTSPDENPANPFVVPVQDATIDLSGEWAGSMYQPNGPHAYYWYNMILEQTGTAVIGVSQVAVTEGYAYYGVMELTGYVQGNTFYFEETRILIEEPPPTIRWCLKSGEMEIIDYDGKVVLEGPWTAPDCLSGTIYIEPYP
ncbi:MAG: hypothetical protein GYB65_17195 [Chloroflexi bacterium]|nr:hypothetical protein [Chloroflexota bacterium]